MIYSDIMILVVLSSCVGKITLHIVNFSLWVKQVLIFLSLNLDNFHSQPIRGVNYLTLFS